MRVAEDGEVDHGGQARLLDRVQREQGLAYVTDGLGDDEVHTLVDGPPHLLVEHGAHGASGLGVSVDEDVGVADIAGNQCISFLRDLSCEADRAAVHLLERALLADQPELLPVGIVGEGQHHVGASAQEVAVQAGDRIGVFQHHFGHVGTGGDVAGPLELEQIALGADERPGLEAIEKARRGGRDDVSHGGGLLVGAGGAAPRRLAWPPCGERGYRCFAKALYSSGILSSLP